MNFAICMATFQRPNGKSPEYLKRSLDCILGQTWTHWTLYVVGDKYENNDEFVRIFSRVPANKLVIENLQNALERENVKRKNDLWSVGGITAMNTARKKAVDAGHTWICHIDDDDTWALNRLEILNSAILQYPEACFVYNYSVHVNGQILPRERVNAVGYNTVMPREANCIHSSYVFHRRFLEQFQMKTWPEQWTKCGDIQTLEFLEKIASEKGEKVLFIPTVLTYHLQEGEVMKG